MGFQGSSFLHDSHGQCLLRIHETVKRSEGSATLESRGLASLLDSMDLEEGIYDLKRYPAENLIYSQVVPSLPERCGGVSLCIQSLAFLEKPELLLLDDFFHLTARD